MNYLFYILFSALTTFGLNRSDLNYDSYFSLKARPALTNNYGANFENSGYTSSTVDDYFVDSTVNIILGYGNKIYMPNSKWWFGEEANTGTKRNLLDINSNSSGAGTSTTTIALQDEGVIKFILGYDFGTRASKNSNPFLSIKQVEKIKNQGLFNKFAARHIISPYGYIGVKTIYFNGFAEIASNQNSTNTLLFGAGLEIKSNQSPWSFNIELDRWSEDMYFPSVNVVTITNTSISFGFNYLILSEEDRNKINTASTINKIYNQPKADITLMNEGLKNISKDLNSLTKEN